MDSSSQAILSTLTSNDTNSRRNCCQGEYLQTHTGYQPDKNKQCPASWTGQDLIASQTGATAAFKNLLKSTRPDSPDGKDANTNKLALPWPCSGHNCKTNDNMVQIPCPLNNNSPWNRKKTSFLQNNYENYKTNTNTRPRSWKMITHSNSECSYAAWIIQ